MLPISLDEVSVRALQQEDLGAYAHLVSTNRALLKGQIRIPTSDIFSEHGTPITFAKQLQRTISGSAWYGIIRLRHQPVGLIWLDPIQPHPYRSAVLGYWVAPEHQNQHVGRQAMALMFDHAFQELELHRVQGLVLEHNGSSLRVADELGCVRIGVTRESVRIGGKWCNEVMFDMLSTQWKQRNTATLEM